MVFVVPLLLFLFSLSSSFQFPQEFLPSQSGYLPISSASASPDSSSQLYFAFYEAQHSRSPLPETPLLLWLQGGPGCSSLLGNFFELGPYLVSNTTTLLSPNPFSWNRLFALLFIDNPLGAGFSLAPSPDHIPRNQSVIAAHLSNALLAFLDSNPSFKTRPIYIAGESYGGKYVPAAAYYILRRSLGFNLRGIAIGNGLTHPVTQVATLADSGYFTGLINAKQKRVIEELQDEAVRLAKLGNWSGAATVRENIYERLQGFTGLATLMDITKKRPYPSAMVGVFLNKEEVKEALGAKKVVVWEECSKVVMKAMHEDVMKSVKFMVEEIVKTKSIRVLLYQGLFDLRDGVVSNEAWIREMKWEGLKGFLEADREVWRVDGEVAGYVQRSEGLSHAVVSGAGHLVPADQGRSSQAMIEDWVLQNGLFGDKKDAV